MATIVWGSWTANSRWRIGIETYYSPTTITTSTSSVTVYTNIWFQVQYSSNESGQSGTTVKLTSPWAAGPTQFDWNLGSNGTKKILSTSRSYTLNYGSTQKLTMSASATVAYTYPGTGTASTTLTLPARPYSAPAAPSAVTLTRGSGESLTSTWTRNATTAAPYTGLETQWFNTKVSAWYTGSSSLAGTATSYASTGATDRKYKIRVRSKNSVGYSAWVESAYVSTTPATPAAPTAAKNAVGDIVVSYAAPASGSSSATYEIWHKANGVTDAAKLASVTAAAGSWTHAAPNTSQTHAYFLKAVSSSPTLTSASSADSATVQLQAPPNAPTGLSPNGPTVDSAASLDLYWTHNPTDTTPQKYREIQHRTSTDGGATWSGWATTGKVSSTTASALAVTGWGNGRHEWQVRTWGAATTGGSDGTGGSPWSSSAIFTIADAPAVAITTPDGAAPVSQSVITGVWGYSQSGGSPQTQWKATLYDSNGVAIQQLTGNDDTTTVTFSKPVLDGSSYSLGVTAKSADGLWSPEALQAFTVDFLEPPSPVIHPSWDPTTGTTLLEVETPGPQAADVTVRKNYSPNPSYRATAGTVAVRTNRFLNPSLRAGSASYWATANNNNTVSATVRTDGDGPLLPNGQSLNYYRMTITAAGASPNYASTGPVFGSSGADQATVLASKQHCITMYYRTNRAREVQLVTTFADSSGATVGSTASGPIVSVPANTWVRLQNVFTTAATAARSTTRAYPAGAAVNFQTNDWIDATGVLVEADCNIPLDYFDGDSPALADESGWYCTWFGAAGASVSTVLGEAVALGSPRSYATFSWYGAKVAGQDVYRMVYLGGNQTYGGLMAWLDGPSVSTVAGDLWAARIQMRIVSGSAMQINPRVALYAPSFLNNVTDTANDVFTIQPDGQWVDIAATNSAAVQSGLTSPSARTMLYFGGAPATPGTVVELRYHLIQKVDVLGQDAGPYFDGSTPTQGDLRHFWEGTPDASISDEFIQQQVDAVSVDIFRSTDLENWTLVGSTDPNSSLSDPVPPLNDTVYYRGESVSALPSVARGVDTSIETDSDRVMYVNAGAGFNDYVRLKHNLSSDEDGGLVNRELHRFAGRRKAVEYSGVEEEHQISIKGTLYGVLQGDDWSEAALAVERAKSSSWEEIVAFAKRKGPFILRTSWGVWKYVSPGKPSISGRGEIEQQVSWTFEETDDAEVPA
jgi:hypothetical protein